MLVGTTPVISDPPPPSSFRVAGVGSGLPGMESEQFQQWVQLLEKRTGIVVPASRREFLESNLRQRMRETGHSSFDAYYDELQGGARGAMEWATLVDRLTVHQTHFFRHQPSFTYIREQWLPEFTAHPDWRGAIESWSVGCATGEEAFSLAMVLDEGLQANASHGFFGVSATDVSQPALMTGKQAIYPANKLREIPANYAARYVQTRSDGQFTMVESLKRRIAFSVFNILELDKRTLPPFDLVYCQNVLIYFARELRIRVLDRIAGLLNPGGAVILGSGEVMGYSNPLLDRIPHRAMLAYRRRRG